MSGTTSFPGGPKNDRADWGPTPLVAPADLNAGGGAVDAPDAEPKAAPSWQGRVMGQSVGGLQARLLADQARALADDLDGAAPGARPPAAERLSPGLREDLQALLDGDWASAPLVNAGREGVDAMPEALGDLLAKGGYKVVEGGQEVEKKLTKRQREEIISVLRQTATPEAARQLVRCLKENSQFGVSLVEDTVKALREMNPVGARAIADGWDGVDELDRERLIPLLASPEALAESDAPVHLAKLLAGAEPDLAVAAGQAVARAGDAAPPGLREVALAKLQDAALTHPSRDKRGDAADAAMMLVKYDPLNAANLDVIAALAKSKDANVLAAVVDSFEQGNVLASAALDPSKRAKVLATLQEFAGSLQGVKRRTDLVFDAIGRLGTPDALRYLQQQAGGKDAATRMEAIHGLVASGDPAAVDTVLRLAQKDPAPEVREAAAGSIAAAGLFGSTASKRANLAKLVEAEKTAAPELKKVLADAISNVEHSLASEPFVDFNSLAQAYGKADHAALADLLSRASAADARKFVEAIKPPTTLGAVLTQIRKSDPKAHARALDAFTFAASKAISLDGKIDAKDAASALYRDAVIEDLKGAPADVARAYAKRMLDHKRGAESHLYNGARMTANLLARAGTEGAIAGLLESGMAMQRPRGGHLAYDNDVRAIVDKLPPERVDRAAAMVLDDPKSAAVAKDNAALLFSRAGSAAGRKRGAEHFEAQVEAANKALAAEMPGLDAQMKPRAERLAKLYQLRDLDRNAPGSLSDAVRDEVRDRAHLTPDEKKRIAKEISKLEGEVRGIQEKREQLAGRAVLFLKDPEVGKALAQLPPERVTKLVEEATTGIGRTKAAKELADKLAHAVEKPEADALFKKVFEHVESAKDKGLKILEHLAPEMILKGEKVLMKGMSRLMGLQRAEQLEELSKAIETLRTGSAAEKKLAEKTIEKLGFKSVLNNVEVAFKGIGTVLTLVELAKDPSFQKAMESVKSASEFTETFMKYVSKSEKAARYAKMAGGAAAVAGAVIAYGEMQDSLKRDDKAGAVFDYIDMAGNVMIAGGTLADLTVVGTVIGVPLQIAGGAVKFIGAAGKWLFGDTDDEKRLKALAEDLGYGVED